MFQRFSSNNSNLLSPIFWPQSLCLRCTSSYLSGSLPSRNTSRLFHAIENLSFQESSNFLNPKYVAYGIRQIYLQMDISRAFASITYRKFIHLSLSSGKLGTAKLSRKRNSGTSGINGVDRDPKAVMPMQRPSTTVDPSIRFPAIGLGQSGHHGLDDCRAGGSRARSTCSTPVNQERFAYLTISDILPLRSFLTSNTSSPRLSMITSPRGEGERSRTRSILTISVPSRS